MSYFLSIVKHYGENLPCNLENLEQYKMWFSSRVIHSDSHLLLVLHLKDQKTYFIIF